MISDSVKHDIEKEADIVIDDLIFYESGYIRLAYSFTFTPVNIESAHERKKRLIRVLFLRYYKKPFKSVSIYNSTIEKNKQKKPKQKKYCVLVKSKEDIAKLDARKAKCIGFMPSYSTIGSLPHSKKQRVITNEEGNREVIEVVEHIIEDHLKKLTLFGRPSIGLPYGTKSRLILFYCATQVSIKKTPLIELDGSFSGLMKAIGINNCTGGKSGNIHDFKDHLKRVSSCMITGETVRDGYNYIQNSSFIETLKIGSVIFGNEEVIRDGSYIKMSKNSYDEIIKAPIPVDTRMIDVIRTSPLAFDLYVWITSTHYSSRKPKFSLPWNVLENKFDSGYTRTRDFKKAFTEARDMVDFIYPNNIKITRSGITVYKGEPHVTPSKFRLTAFS